MGGPRAELVRVAVLELGDDIDHGPCHWRHRFVLDDLSRRSRARSKQIQLCAGCCALLRFEAIEDALGTSQQPGWEPGEPTDLDPVAPSGRARATR